MLDRSGIDTGVDMAALLAASAYIEQRLGHANPGAARPGRDVPRVTLVPGE